MYLRCALIHRHRPDLIDYDSLDKVFPSVILYLSLTCPQEDRFGNTKLAFDVAEQHLGIAVSSSSKSKPCLIPYSKFSKYLISAS